LNKIELFSGIFQKNQDKHCLSIKFLNFTWYLIDKAMIISKHSTSFARCTLSVFLLFAIGLNVNGQSKRAPVNTRILFILDESNSMTANWESGKKIDVAIEILTKLVDSIKTIENVEMALRMYGHQSPVTPQDCNDTKLEIPFGAGNADKINLKIRTTKPKGTTPIARSLEECGNDFPPCNNCRNIIILITDGIEACGGDPCKIALTLQNKGITIKPFIIGIGLDVKFKSAFECIGNFYNAEKEGQFEIIMKEVVHKSLNGTTTEIDLLNTAGEPKETNVNITLFNQKTGEIYKDFIHTLNFKGNPDTLSLPTSITYNMKVHTIPPVFKENIVLTEGKHNKIIASTPQGQLNIIQENGLELKKTLFIVRKHGEMNTINIQEVFEPEHYLTGNYDIEILTLPRIYLNDIKITQSKTNLIKIEQPGIVNVSFPSKGYAGIYKISKKDVELIINMNMKTKETVCLQPGHYIAVFRTENADQTTWSQERHFIIRSGQSVNISFD
jgi:Ca-activated chloride channel family protein